MVLIGAALIGAIVLLAVGGGDEDSGSKQTAELQDRFLDRTVVDSKSGISVRIPGNWSVQKKLHVINIKSRDRCLVMNLSAPVPKNKASSLRREGVGFLKAAYENAKVRPAPASSLGGVPTTTNVITFTNSKGKRVRVLLSVGKGDKNAYLTQVVLGNPTCQDDLALAQIVLTSVEYTK